MQSPDLCIEQTEGARGLCLDHRLTPEDHQVVGQALEDHVALAAAGGLAAWGAAQVLFDIDIAVLAC